MTIDVTNLGGGTGDTNIRKRVSIAILPRNDEACDISDERTGEDAYLTMLATTPKPLRVCCYGASSSRTPKKYIDAAYQLGHILARRGHTCVNGAGSSGCMAAMNCGADDGGGHIVGVMHEKFINTSDDWFEGMHTVFHEGCGHEIIVARGEDLQERKRLLVEGADALAVLPGGPGTWDELWEMACARHIGFHSMPIVCINTDGYYDAFRAMLTRAYDDQLLYKHPEDILHFEETPEAAVMWIESYLTDPPKMESVYLWTEKKREAQQKVTYRDMLKRMQSNVSGSAMSAFRRMPSFFGDSVVSQLGVDDYQKGYRQWVVFTAGLSLGVLIASRMSCLRSK